MLQYPFPLWVIVNCYGTGSLRPQLKLEPVGLSIVQKEGKTDTERGEGGAVRGVT